MADAIVGEMLSELLKALVWAPILFVILKLALAIPPSRDGW